MCNLIFKLLLELFFNEAEKSEVRCIFLGLRYTPQGWTGNGLKECQEAPIP